MGLKHKEVKVDIEVRPTIGIRIKKKDEILEKK
jgi:hypothetical protein